MVKKRSVPNLVYSMEKKLLTSVSLAALLFAVACGAFKPDHPQVYQSFKDRRAPKENVMAESGALGKTEAKNESNFRPYSGKGAVASTAGSKAAQRDSDMVATRAPAANSRSIAYAEQPAPRSESSASNSDSIVDKFLKWLSASAEPTVEVTSLEKRTPSDNAQSVVYNVALDGQGSANSYSYYEMAHEVPATSGEFGQIQNADSYLELAQNTVTPPPVIADPTPPTSPTAAPAQPAPAHPAPAQPAAKAHAQPAPVPAHPMVAVPKEPSLDEMKTQSATQPQPDLKNIPQQPKEFTKQPDAAANKDSAAVTPDSAKKKKVVKRKKAKAVKAQRRYDSDPYQYGQPNPEGIRDRTSSLQNINGKPVVTGYLVGCDALGR